MYSGTLGMKHKPELLLELAKHFAIHDDVVIVVIAQGAGADWLRQHADRKQQSLLMLPFQPYERLAEVLSAADVLISILDSDCGVFAVPSKTLSYLCAGRPLLVAAPERNLAAQIVRRAGAGQVVSDAAPESFLAAAVNLLEDAALRGTCSARAREYAERTFDIANITQQFLEIFDFSLRGPRVLGKALVRGAA
jgi:glycosyltransferase involved in cell wall biosynthesis